MKPRPELPEMAMSIHSEHYLFLMAIYIDQDQDQMQQSWILDWFREMDSKGWLLGTYIGDAHPRDRPHRYWKESAMARIQQIGAQWDPDARIRSIILGECS